MPRTAEAVRGRQGDHAALLRTHLLDATERLLADGSPAALTTRRIARAAGVSDGVLYNHFSDKDALVIGAMTRRVSSLLDGFRASLPEAGNGSLEANLARIAEAALAVHLALLPMVGSLLADEALLRRFLVEIHRADVGAAELVDAVARYLDQERDLGRVADVDTRTAADLLVGAVAIRAFTTALGAERGLDGLVTTLVAGLEPA